MRVIIQRVAKASVTIDQKLFSAIGPGLLVLVGVEESDNQEDINYISDKVLKIRLFDDSNGVMNLSVEDIAGELMIVSQFTLFASTKKGNRPSYFRAAPPPISVPLYEEFCKTLQHKFGRPIQTGLFGADMKIELINDGPVTISIDSKNKE